MKEESIIYFSKYKPTKKIGEGSFGKIYSAININNNEKFALKMENREGGQNLLESEAYVMCYLKGKGIPFVKSYGFSGEFNILVMELLDKSLEDYLQECGGKFSLKTVCMIADQMYIHEKHIIHRDIKPDNFVVGTYLNRNLIYLIDFGLSKKYRSSKTLEHIQFKNNKKLTGTARYASINALRGLEQSRRDDLEAIGYVLMYFLRGSLPWQGLKVEKKEDRYKKIYEKKKGTSTEELCSNFPQEFGIFLNYCKNLAFEQEPDYKYLKGLFQKVMSAHELKFDFEFDWSSKLENNSDQYKNQNEKEEDKKHLNRNQNQINLTNENLKEIDKHLETNYFNLKKEKINDNLKKDIQSSPYLIKVEENKDKKERKDKSKDKCVIF